MQSHNKTHTRVRFHHMVTTSIRQTTDNTKHRTQNSNWMYNRQNTQYLHDEIHTLPIREHLQLHASQIRQRSQDATHPLHYITTQQTTPRRQKQTIYNNTDYTWILPEDIVCKITHINNIRTENTCDPVIKLLNEEITSDIQKHIQNIWKEHIDAHWDNRHNTHILWKPHTTTPSHSTTK